MSKKKAAKKVASKPTLKSLLKKVADRCDEADIKSEQGVDDDGDDFVKVHLPNGRDTRSFSLWERAEVNQFVEIEFERFTFVGDYVAIACYEDNTIEAVVQSVTPISSSRLPRMLGFSHEGDDDSDVKFVVSADDSDAVITFSECSEEMKVLSDLPILRRVKRWAIKIEGVEFSTHANAQKLLERVSNSLFFQIDVARNVSLRIARDRKGRRSLLPTRSQPDDTPELQFPTVEYDQAPITLYWYARSATAMPLLQFLAYYQCVEFYYPTYSQTEARRRIRNVLKSPTFRADRDSDLTRVLTALGTGKRSITDERSMLRATLQECVPAETVREFIEQNDQRVEYYARDYKELSECKVPVKTKELDLRDSIADRIYDIRCQIVHTKSGGDTESSALILPYSKKEEMLGHDIGLLRIISQHVLIAGSSNLRL